jgi:hypothetical protein
MSRFIFARAVLLIALVPSRWQVAARADEQLVKSQIARLADRDGDVRAAAAAELRSLLTGDHDAITDNHGRLYWEEEIRQVKPGMKHDDVLRILPPVDKNISGQGTGQTHSKSWRIDDYWTVNVYYHNPDVVQVMSPSLNRRARAVWVEPPAGFAGKWTTWHVNGQKAQEIEYQDGKYHGTYAAFYDNGCIANQQNYENGVSNGADQGWYADGGKSYEGQYINGQQDGTWTHWHADGRLQTRREMRSGEYHGVSTAWHENGQRESETTYQNGKQHGPDKVWNAAGELIRSQVYENGELVR